MEKNRIKILAIDDNTDNLISVKALVREAFPDSNTLTASSGRSGLELAQAEDPDVILLDVLMPGMDGFEVCQTLKSNPSTCDIPVVYLTALKGDQASRIRALEVGGDAFLAKPIDEIELTAQIRAMQKIKNANDQKKNEKESLARLLIEQTRELEKTHAETLHLLEELHKENEARKENESALYESELRLRKAQHFAHMGSWTWNIKTGQLLWSDEMYNIFGLDKNTFTGVITDVIAQAIHPDDRAEVDRSNLSVIQYGIPIPLEYRIIWPDGTVRTVWAEAGELIRDEKGAPALLSGTVQDITERKQTELALQNQMNFFEQMFSQSSVSTQILDKDGWCERINPKLSEIFGVEPQYMEGKAYNIFKDEELKRSGIIPTLKKVFQEGQTAEWDVFFDIGVAADSQNIQVKEKKQVWYHNWAYPIFDEQQQLSHVIIQHNDITLRKQAEELARQYAAELEQRVEQRTADLSRVNSDLARALRASDEFLASMSHELRTPLTGILGLSESMQFQTYGALNERQSQTLKIIEESGHHLLELINDILDLSKIQAGKLELQFSSCSISDICQASLHMAKGMAHQKKQNLFYTATPEHVFVMADGRRLKQILVNLLGNAIKFTPEGGDLGLDVQADAAGHLVRLTVWDKGIGIEQEDLPRIFKPFVQLDGGLTRQYPGSGLGLSLVQRLTEMHKGSIEIESLLGQGSRFTISLPWSPQADKSIIDDRLQPDLEQSSMAGINPGHTQLPLVMFADDNENILQMITDFLEEQPYRVMPARSGLELIEKAEQYHPAIMLVDIQMPGMDGLETIRRLRSHADPHIVTIPIIAITALAMSGDRELCLRAGANEYLSKPVKLKELAAIIRKLLEAKQ
jgi:PAS domain S-box-containing protein